jgi:hypothetical protein
MKSRQRKKLKKIILKYWMARNKVLELDFSPESISCLQKVAVRYKAIPHMICRKLSVELSEDLDKYGPPC